MNSAVANTASATVGTTLTAAAERLALVGVPTARLDAELLLAHAWQRTRANVLAAVPDSLPATVVVRFAALVARRAEREPLAYIVGRQEFWSLEFEVTPDVLIPRPETELLVETALRLIRSSGPASPRIADVGTGSGCIAVALATELPAAKVWASDASAAALNVARRNAARLCGADRINFGQGDLFDPLLDGAPFDVVCANPPYVAESSAASLQPEVLREPGGALFAGEDGIDLICRLIVDAPRLLAPTGTLLVEIGADQRDRAHALAEDAGYARVNVVDDYAGLPRLLVAEVGR